MNRWTEWRAALAAVVFAGLLFGAGCSGGEARKSRHVEQGREFMAERNYTKARIEFRNALQIDPKDAEVRALVGYTSEKLGEYDDAVKAYRVAVAADPLATMPRARLARILAVAGLAEEAEDLVTQGLAASPESAALLGVRAVLHQQKGDAAAARADAEQAYTLDPTDPDVVMTLASIRWPAGEREETLAMIRKVIDSRPDEVELRLLLARLLLGADRPAEAERELLEVVRLEPQRVENHSLLARVYAVQGRKEEAIEAVRGAAKANPDSVETKIALARLLGAYRSLEDAERQLDEYRKATPKDYALRVAIGDFLAANGKTEQAIATYRAVVEDAGTQSWAQVARNRLAKGELEQGRYEAASNVLDEVLDENPNDAEALAMRAEIAMRRGDATAALADLRTAISGQPDSVRLAVALARAHMQLGQTDLAEQALRSLVQASPRNALARMALAQFLGETGRLPQALAVLQQVAADEPANVVAQEALFGALLAGGAFDGALAAARAVQALQPGAARGLYLEGVAEQRRGRADAARKAFEAAAAVDARAPDPLAALVGLDLGAGQSARALARVQQQIAASPNDAQLLALQGDTYMRMGQPAEAAASFERAAAASPTWAPAYRGQAIAWRAAGENDKAIAALQQGLSGTRGAPEIANELMALYSRLGRGDEAIALAEKTLARKPGDRIAANNMAMLLAQHRTDAASLARAASLTEGFEASNDASLLDTRGWVLLRQGRYGEAVSALEKAVTLAPRDSQMRYHLGMAQLGAGQRAQGQANLEAALASGVAFDGADDARAALAALQ